jgi:hypothetical protein
MKESWLQAVIFGIALATAAASLRFVLGTHLGMLAAAIGIALGSLWLLFQSTRALVFRLWGVSGALAQRMENTYQRRAAVKESRHAARLL